MLVLLIPRIPPTLKGDHGDEERIAARHSCYGNFNVDNGVYGRVRANYVYRPRSAAGAGEGVVQHAA